MERLSPKSTERRKRKSEGNLRSPEVIPQPPSRADEIRAIADSERFHEIFDVASPARPYSDRLRSARNPNVWHADALSKTRGLLGELVPDYTDYDQKALSELFFQAWSVHRSLGRIHGGDLSGTLGMYQADKEDILEDLKPKDRDVILAIHETVIEKGIYRDISKKLAEVSKKS